jgi:hypothetical protein
MGPQAGGPTVVVPTVVVPPRHSSDRGREDVARRPSAHRGAARTGCGQGCGLSLYLPSFIGILITLVHNRIRLHECVLPMSSCIEAARCATYLPSPPISIEPGGAAAAAGRSPCGGLRGLARSRSPSEAPPNRCGRAKGRRAPQRLSGPPRVHRRWSACRCTRSVAHDDPRHSACLLLGDGPPEPCRTGSRAHRGSGAVPPRRHPHGAGPRRRAARDLPVRRGHRLGRWR